jgi:glycosyltransferase involved in cell wall biosynthesis
LLQQLGSLFSLAFSGFTVNSVYETEAAQKKFTEEMRKSGLAFLERADKNSYPFISVLVPARNEEALIESCLRSILDQSSSGLSQLVYPSERFEVIAVDDGSTDATPDILVRLQAQYGSDRLKIVSNPLMSPETEAQGWLGKSYALHSAYQKVDPRSEFVLFIDADTRLKEGALLCSVSYIATKAKLGLFSLVPDQSSFKDFWFRTNRYEIIRFFYLSQALGSFAKMVYLYLTGSRGRIASEQVIENANALGAFLLFRRKTYEVIGGHYSVRRYMRDDVGFAKKVRRYGYDTWLGLGEEFVELTPYQNRFAGLWSGTTKTIFMSTDKNWLIALIVIMVEALYHFAIPIYNARNIYKTLMHNKTNTHKKGFWQLVKVVLSLVDIVAYIFALHTTYKHLKIPRIYIVGYPLSVVISIAMMLYSAFRISKGKVAWKGRTINFSLDG